MRFMLAAVLVWVYNLIIIGLYELSAIAPFPAMLLFALLIYASALWLAYKSDTPPPKVRGVIYLCPEILKSD